MPRLARHTLTLDDGHQVGVAVCGRGVPLVVVHGFSAEGILYAQTLSRLVDLGFKVVAIDAAGHGGTLGLPTGAGTFSNYTRAARPGARPPRHREGRARRTLDGRPAGHRARGHATRAGRRRHPARRDRRRHVGQHGQPLPAVPAAARRRRCHAVGRHADHDPAVPRSGAGAQARPARDARPCSVTPAARGG